MPREQIYTDFFRANTVSDADRDELNAGTRTESVRTFGARPTSKAPDRRFRGASHLRRKYVFIMKKSVKVHLLFANRMPRTASPRAIPKCTWPSQERCPCEGHPVCEGHVHRDETRNQSARDLRKQDAPLRGILFAKVTCTEMKQKIKVHVRGIH